MPEAAPDRPVPVGGASGRGPAGDGGRRWPLIDGLRGLALVGVVVVNGVGYAHLPDTLYVVPPPVPADAPVAFAAQFAIVALLQGKAYPLMAFLFGFGLALAWRSARRSGDDPAARGRRRLRRLGLLGIAHGLLLYSGDILTAYALVGWWLLGWMRLRARALVGRLVVVTLLALALAGVEAWALASMVGDPIAWGAPPQGYAWVDGVATHVGLSAAGYATALVGLPFVVPQILALMTAGVLAARLGLLTRRRWRPVLRRFARWGLPVALALNAVIAWFVMREASSAGGVPHPAAAALLLAGPALTLAVVARLALEPPGWLLGLAGAGRFSLSVYLAASVAFAVLIGGAGLAWGRGAPSLALAGISTGTCLVLLALAGLRARYRRGGPLERWLAR
jgi:uncharacterized protein